MQRGGEMNKKKVAPKRMDDEVRKLAETFDTIRNYGNCSSH
jgi:hypothetical protein